MIIVVHVLLAVSSIASASLAFVAPSRAKLRTSYCLVAATLLSGTYLAIAQGTHMLASCMMGLVYVGFVTTAIVVAQRKLATVKIPVKSDRSR